MTPRLITARFRSTLRRSLVGLCLVAHVGMTIGFPLPEAPPIEAGSKPYPCQHHHCGCRSAEHCWRSCCCMSMGEKLAWARENGVTPPDYVLAAAAVETEDHDEHEHDEHEAGSCCDPCDEKPASCCATKRLQPAKACCSAAVSKKCHAGPWGRGTCENNRQGPSGGVDWVLGMHAQKCQGLSTLWVISGAVLPPPAPFMAPVDSAPPLWWSVPAVCVWQTVSKQPDVPPPRHV